MKGAIDTVIKKVVNIPTDSLKTRNDIIRHDKDISPPTTSIARGFFTAAFNDISFSSTIYIFTDVFAILSIP